MLLQNSHRVLQAWGHDSYDLALRQCCRALCHAMPCCVGQCHTTSQYTAASGPGPGRPCLPDSQAWRVCCASVCC